mmetsp:Transcript_37406/g.87235  ORF Transcript_37406/g.87235 Transcript_37406/m.87235 type:complete len:619 (-) Transcript_37406:48-1904(-)
MMISGVHTKEKFHLFLLAGLLLGLTVVSQFSPTEAFVSVGVPRSLRPTLIRSAPPLRRTLMLSPIIRGRQIHRYFASYASTPNELQEDGIVFSLRPHGSSAAVGRLTLIVPSDPLAPTAPDSYGRASPIAKNLPVIREVAIQLVQRLHNFEPRMDCVVISADGRAAEALDDVDDDDGDDVPHVLVALQLTDAFDVDRERSLFAEAEGRPAGRPLCTFALRCDPSPTPGVRAGRVGAHRPAAPSSATALPWTSSASESRLYDLMVDQFGRCTSDEFAASVLYGVHHFRREQGSPGVPWVEHSIDATWEKGPVRNAKEIYAMATSCGSCIQDCLADEKCRECITALQEVDTRDQVKSYRTIVSYESELLKEFSFCILTKNNIFGCDATIPDLPKVEPIETWRGKPLTRDAAKQILVAHLDDDAAPSEVSQCLPTSWKVACGANVAYDQFPDQNQLFYPTLSGKDMWYDPVFRVETLDGRQVWCTRHYRVREGREKVGTFRLSVLDNGVTSDELWTITGAADDLSWAVFHYAGAAKAVGQRYLGGLVCTPDGSLPEQEEVREEIWAALRCAQIEPWELFVVDNASGPTSGAGPPPLDFYRADILEKMEAKKKKDAERATVS